MNKYIRILRSFNISALFVSLLYVLFLLLFASYSDYFWIFLGTSLCYIINIWLLKREHYQSAYLLFMAANCTQLLVFDAGIYGPTHSYIFYIPLLLCNSLIIDPKKVYLRILVLTITLLCIVITTVFDITPKLSLYIYTAKTQTTIIYFNVSMALTMTLLMMEVIIRNTEKAEKTLINQKHLLDSVNQNISEGIFRSNGNSEFLYVNNALVKIFGFHSAAEMMKYRTPMFFEDQHQRILLIDLLKRKGYYNNQEVQFIRKDGTRFWGLLSVILTTDENGNHSFDGAVRDITPFKKIEEEVLHAKHLAEKASRAKTNFLSAMSHEIRTPMNAVIGITNLLLMNKNRDEQENENLMVLKSSAENLMSMLNDLLDLNKIEAGKFNINPAYTNLAQDLNDLLNVYQFHAKEKGISLLKDLQFSACDYLVDKVRLIQVISNLLSNAIKFTETGFVKLRVITVKKEGSLCTLNFAVEDSGIGIDPLQQQNIFHAFTQENEETALHYGGSGLGLTISKNILKKMESAFVLHSEKGKGSVFSFELILDCKSPSTIEKTESFSQLASLKGLNVLLAEDNLINIRLIKQFMAVWGVTPKIAMNGAEAIELAKTNAFDVILMDLHMPLTNGLEATRSLRNNSSDVPIIGLSADALSESKEQCLAAGMNDYITKPFTPEELYHKIRRHHTQKELG